MKHLVLISLFFSINCFVFGQFNMTFQGRLDYGVLHDARLSSIWGYVDETGNEYALVGTSKGTSIVNVSNPTSPFEVAWIAGETNQWREIKTFGNYAYVSTEAEEGLLIIDLSPLPQSTNLPYSYYFGNSGVTFQSHHTLWIDDLGYLYLFGTNYGIGGGIICDLNVSRTNPPVVATFSNTYIHDGIVNGDRLYTGNIQEGYFQIYDIIDRRNPVLLGQQTTPHSFTHNVAPTPDNNFAFTTDERANAFIASYDVSDPTNIRELDRIRSTENTAIIPHNVHYKDNNFLVTSYYTDGVVIHDVTYPYNMVKVGQFDTSPLNSPTFGGCWGVYPYLPSGNLVASDIELGLFVIAPTYKRGAYLEGVVYDAATNEIIHGAKVQLPDRSKFSNDEGFYANGMGTYGLMDVRFEKIGYYPQIIQVNFQEGVKVELDVYLVPMPLFPLEIIVKDAETQQPILEANIAIDHISNELIYEGLSNGLGERTFQLAYEEEYSLSVSIWGYKNYCETQLITENTQRIIIELEKGYADNFRADLGWQTTATAYEGLWERAIPVESEGGANPGYDSFDCDKYAYLTGNSSVFGISADDVEGGIVRLISPMMDLRSYTNPHINFHYWFYNFYGQGPLEDKLEVSISNGSTSVIIASIGKPEEYNQMFSWYYKSIPIRDLIPVTEFMQVIFKTEDFDDSRNIVEAAIDNFSVTNENAMSTEDIKNELIILFPNPFSDELKISTPFMEQIQITDIQGKVLKLEWKKEGVLSTENWTPGIYLVNVGTEVKKVVKK